MVFIAKVEILTLKGAYLNMIA